MSSPLDHVPLSYSHGLFFSFFPVAADHPFEVDERVYEAALGRREGAVFERELLLEPLELVGMLFDEVISRA